MVQLRSSIISGLTCPKNTLKAWVLTNFPKLVLPCNSKFTAWVRMALQDLSTNPEASTRPSCTSTSLKVIWPSSTTSLNTLKNTSARPASVTLIMLDIYIITRKVVSTSPSLYTQDGFIKLDRASRPLGSIWNVCSLERPYLSMVCVLWFWGDTAKGSRPTNGHVAVNPQAHPYQRHYMQQRKLWHRSCLSFRCWSRSAGCKMVSNINQIAQRVYQLADDKWGWVVEAIHEKLKESE